MPFTLDTSGFEKLTHDAMARVKAREKKAVLAGAKILRDEVEARAPVGDTRKLKDNIIVTEPQTDKNGEVYAYVGPRSEGKDAPFYGKFVEFGTSKMRAQPFVEPAFHTKKNDMMHAMAEVMREGIEGGGGTDV
jgi:HK97 gp10 family phage protein